MENVECIAAVPVGLTKYREGLEQIKPFDKERAAQVIDIIDKAGDKCVEKYGERRIYAADEFYLLSGREIPQTEYYEDFLQLENGVGLWALLKSDAETALEDVEEIESNRHISLATGVAAEPLIKYVAELCSKKAKGLKCDVYGIKNDFFGEKITVAGLVTATDIYEQLKNKDLGEELLIPSAMLRKERDMFLDSITVDELSEKLNVKITVVECDGYSLTDAILGC